MWKFKIFFVLQYRVASRSILSIKEDGKIFTKKFDDITPKKKKEKK